MAWLKVQSRTASPGVDGSAIDGLRGGPGEPISQDLHDRVSLGHYRSRLREGGDIPKAHGRLRPLGIATEAA